MSPKKMAQIKHTHKHLLTRSRHTVGKGWILFICNYMYSVLITKFLGNTYLPRVQNSPTINSSCHLLPFSKIVVNVLGIFFFWGGGAGGGCVKTHSAFFFILLFYKKQHIGHRQY